MSTSAQAYLEHLRIYLNMHCYGKTCLPSEAASSDRKELRLSEKLEGTKLRRKITLHYDEEAFALKLDQGSDPLFHFLSNNDGHPWSKRCDFVIFERRKGRFFAHCVEFKEATTGIPVDQVFLQLRSAESWCCVLHKIISTYVNESLPLYISKYVFTSCRDPIPDLDPSRRYLKKHPTIRHYLFADVDGSNLTALENSTVRVVRS